MENSEKTTEINTKIKIGKADYRKLLIKLIAEDDLKRTPKFIDIIDVFNTIEKEYSDKFILPSEKTFREYIKEIVGKKQKYTHMCDVHEACRKEYKMVLLFEMGITNSYIFNQEPISYIVIFTNTGCEYNVTKVIDNFFDDYFEGYISGKKCITAYFKDSVSTDDFCDEYNKAFKIFYPELKLEDEEIEDTEVSKKAEEND